MPKQKRKMEVKQFAPYDSKPDKGEAAIKTSETPLKCDEQIKDIVTGPMQSKSPSRGPERDEERRKIDTFEDPENLREYLSTHKPSDPSWNKYVQAAYGRS